MVFVCMFIFYGGPLPLPLPLPLPPTAPSWIAVDLDGPNCHKKSVWLDKQPFF